MKSRVNGKKREFEGERKPGIKVWQSLNFLDWRLKFRASRLVLYTWEHILFQLKYGLRRKTTYFACDTGSINYNRHLFICHHSCLLESRFGEEFQYRLLSFFCFSWVILQTSGDYYHTVIGKTNTTQFQSTFASLYLCFTTTKNIRSGRVGPLVHMWTRENYTKYCNCSLTLQSQLPRVVWHSGLNWEFQLNSWISINMI